MDANELRDDEFSDRNSPVETASVLDTKIRVPFEASARKVMFVAGVESQYVACSLTMFVVGGENMVFES